MIPKGGGGGNTTPVTPTKPICSPDCFGCQRCLAGQCVDDSGKCNDDQTCENGYCLGGCPRGAPRLSDGTCDCSAIDSTLSYDSTYNVCHCSDSNAYFNGSSCKTCPTNISGVYPTADGKSCDCDAAASGTIFDEERNLCVCSNEYEYYNGTFCTACPEINGIQTLPVYEYGYWSCDCSVVANGLGWSGEQCSCSNNAGDGGDDYWLDVENNSCQSCPYVSGYGQTYPTSDLLSCECPSGMVFDKDIKICKCESEYDYFDGSSCRACPKIGEKQTIAHYAYDYTQCDCSVISSALSWDGSNCTCGSSDYWYNSDTDSCQQCPYVSGWGQMYSTSDLLGCECPGVTVFDKENNVCRCSNTDEWWDPSYNTCYSCPSLNGVQSTPIVDTSGYWSCDCSAISSALMWDPSYQTGGLCYCGDDSWFDANSNECRQCPYVSGYGSTYPREDFLSCYCPGDSDHDVENNVCRCAGDNEWYDYYNGCQTCPTVAGVQSTVQFDSSGYSWCDCSVISSALSWDGSNCTCGSSDYWYNADTGSCQQCPYVDGWGQTYPTWDFLGCDCPSGTQFDGVNNICRCSNGNQWYYAGSCYDCPSGVLPTEDGQFCDCPYPLVFYPNRYDENGNYGLCLCSNPDSEWYDSDAGYCQSCPNGTYPTADGRDCNCSYYYDNTYLDKENNICRSNDSTVWYDGSSYVSCPQFNNIQTQAVYESGSWTCSCSDISDALYFDTSSNRCVCSNYYDNWFYADPDGNPKTDDAICQSCPYVNGYGYTSPTEDYLGCACPSGMVFDKENNICRCEDENQWYDYYNGCQTCPTIAGVQSTPQFDSSGYSWCDCSVISSALSWDGSNCRCGGSDNWFYPDPDGDPKTDDGKCQSCPYVNGNHTYPTSDYLSCECPSGTVFDKANNLCRCEQDNYWWNSGDSTCYACPTIGDKQAVSINKDEIGTDGTYCSCSAISNSLSWDGSRCSCGPENWFNVDTNSCQSCPRSFSSQPTSDGLACECPSYLRFDPNTNTCRCGENEFLATGSVCLSCPEIKGKQVPSDSASEYLTCDCASFGYVWSQASETCLCGDSSWLDPETWECHDCPYASGYGQTYSTYKSGLSCECPTGTFHDLENNVCSCGGNYWYDYSKGGCNECPTVAGIQSTPKCDGGIDWSCDCSVISSALMWDSGYQSGGVCYCGSSDYWFYPDPDGDPKTDDGTCQSCPYVAGSRTSVDSNFLSCFCPSGTYHDLENNVCRCSGDNDWYQGDSYNGTCYTCPSLNGVQSTPTVDDSGYWGCDCSVISSALSWDGSNCRCGGSDNWFYPDPDGDPKTDDGKCQSCPYFNGYGYTSPTEDYLGCACPSGTVFDKANNICRCEKDNYWWNSGDSTCYACPTIGDKQAVSINKDEIGTDGTYCHCPVISSDLQWTTDNRGMCVCGGSDHWFNPDPDGDPKTDDGKCQSCPYIGGYGYASSSEDYLSCECPSGMVFDKVNNICRCENENQWYDYYNGCQPCPSVNNIQSIPEVDTNGNWSCDCSVISSALSWDGTYFYSSGSCSCGSDYSWFDPDPDGNPETDDGKCQSCPDIEGYGQISITLDYLGCDCPSGTVFDKEYNTCRCKNKSQWHYQGSCYDCPDGVLPTADGQSCNCAAVSELLTYDYDPNGGDSDTNRNMCHCSEGYYYWYDEENNLCKQCTSGNAVTDDGKSCICTYDSWNPLTYNKQENRCRCPEDNYWYDPGGSCNECPAGATLTSSSSDIGRCDCPAPLEFHLDYNNSDRYGVCLCYNADTEWYNSGKNECLSCPDGSYPTPDGLSCQCDGDYKVFNRDANTCDCMYGKDETGNCLSEGQCDSYDDCATDGSKYCRFSPTSSTSNGVAEGQYGSCTELTGNNGGVGAVTLNIDWWSAQDWCAALGMQMADPTSVGLMRPFWNANGECVFGNGEGVSHTDKSGGCAPYCI